eukprot:7188700-Alexandrium_andersonii.AAC.1
MLLDEGEISVGSPQGGNAVTQGSDVSDIKRASLSGIGRPRMQCFPDARDWDEDPSEPRRGPGRAAEAQPGRARHKRVDHPATMPA